ncbi:MAG: SCO1664 family protein [Actinomycetes bacterium]
MATDGDVEKHGSHDSVIVSQVLLEGMLTVEGRLSGASNATLFCIAELDGVQFECVYKPVMGERPLWDFPDGTLGHREVAAYEVAATFATVSDDDAVLIPETIWREEGPFGAGSCQRWIDVSDTQLVDIIESQEEQPGWLSVLEASDDFGRPVQLIHQDDARLRQMALLDIVTNNSDRKGGHILVDQQGNLFGVDHGLCFNVEDKLRTVLWGWAGQPLTADEVTSLDRLRDQLVSGDLGTRLKAHLEPFELNISVERIEHLLQQGHFVEPTSRWPSIPWPAF